MAEGGYEMGGFDRKGDEWYDEYADVEETSFIEPSMNTTQEIEAREKSLNTHTGRDYTQQSKELLKSKVNAFFESVTKASGLLPAVCDFNDFQLEHTDGKLHLFIKDGHIELTNSRNTSQYLAVATLVGKLGLSRFQALFPDYNPKRRNLPTKQAAALAAARDDLPTNLTGENIEIAVIRVDAALHNLAATVGTNTAANARAPGPRQSHADPTRRANKQFSKTN